MEVLPGRTGSTGGRDIGQGTWALLCCCGGAVHAGRL